MDAYASLERARELKIQIENLRRDYKCMMPAPGSPKMDGMPKGGADDHGPDWIDKRDRLWKKIENLESEHRRVMKTVDAVMEGMPHDLYRLCMYYFVSAYDNEDVFTFMEISRRTFYNWKKEVYLWCKSYDEGYSEHARC